MGIRLDLIIPPIIVGLMILAIFGLKSFIMETSVDTRLNNDVQMFAELSSRLIQEQVKSATQIVEPANPDTVLSTLVFLNVARDTVKIERSGRNLKIIQISSTKTDSLLYPSNLSSLSFDLERKPLTVAIPYYLNVTIETESNPYDHVLTDNTLHTVRGFAENEIYLRNIHRNSLSASEL